MRAEELGRRTVEVLERGRAEIPTIPHLCLVVAVLRLVDGQSRFSRIEN
jgi:hypothetical protein